MLVLYILWKGITRNVKVDPIYLIAYQCLFRPGHITGKKPEPEIPNQITVTYNIYFSDYIMI